MTPAEPRSLSGRRWHLRDADPARVAALVAQLHCHPVAATVYAARAVDERFFDAGLGDLLDPSSLRGLGLALERLRRARRDGEHVRLVTDYDVDGTTSCLILHAALDRLGGVTVSYHIPDRFTEGYGLSVQAVDQAIADGVHLLVTADIGVRDHVTVARAHDAGIDVIVCDHHLPAGEAVPSAAVAVLCPPQPGCAYPNKALAACGVSLKLAGALLVDDPRRAELLDSMLKLAAIGTVCDVVDLANAENRAIVTLGLRSLNRGPHSAGLAALLTVAGARIGEITAETLGWRVGPRINAAGRLADASAVVKLIRERDPPKALAQANLLDELNRERQDIQERLVETALQRVPTPPPAFVVIAGPEDEGFHRGVVGIVAAKVRERVNRPVAVVSILGEVATGSVRSVPGVHATKALDSVAHLLHRHGGHAAAAGFTVATARLVELGAALAAFVEAHGGDEALVAEEWIDAVVEPAMVDLRLIQDLARLEPTGKGNEPARLVVRGVPTAIAVLKGRHVRFRLGSLRCIWWNGADRQDWLVGPREVLGRASVNTYNGRSEAQFVVDDLR